MQLRRVDELVKSVLAQYDGFEERKHVTLIQDCVRSVTLSVSMVEESVSAVDESVAVGCIASVVREFVSVVREARSGSRLQSNNG